jgi:hypothetical protein
VWNILRQDCWNPVVQSSSRPVNQQSSSESKQLSKQVNKQFTVLKSILQLFGMDNGRRCSIHWSDTETNQLSEKVKIKLPGSGEEWNAISTEHNISHLQPALSGRPERQMPNRTRLNLNL